jgi:hypothetical protein
MWPRILAKINFDECDLCTIRRIINFLKTEQQQRPKLKTVLNNKEEEMDFRGCKESLSSKVISLTGFRCRKCEDNWKLLTERHYIRMMKITHLRKEE